MLGLSIQIRILRNVQEAERERRADQRVLIGMLTGAGASAAAREGDQNVVGLGLSGMEAPALDTSESASTVRPVSPSGLKTPTLSVAFPSPSPSPTASPMSTPTPTPTPTPGLALTPSLTLSPRPSPPRTPPALQPTQVLPELQTVQASQDAQDLAHDSEDLRTLIRAALRTGSDVEIFRLLQIAREEMPEAIKTLQRALERVGDGGATAPAAAAAIVTASAAKKENGGVKNAEKEKEKKRWGLGLRRTRASLSLSPSAGGRTSPGSRGSLDVRTATDAPGTGANTVTNNDTWGANTDTLDREFIESGIDALR
ncbi:hypothetical protein C0992_003940, partial [Termitomyces sp. T32_za158]